MKIKSYSFGKIIINNKVITSDLIIYPNRIDDNWWRQKSHLLQLDDISDILASKPDKIIIGTGFWGLMKIDKKVISKLKDLNIELIAKKTEKAVEIYNQISSKQNIIMGLHLTC